MTLYLKDTKDGDEVVLYVCMYSGLYAVSSIKTSLIFAPGKVLATTSHFGDKQTLIGWKLKSGARAIDVPQYGQRNPTPLECTKYSLSGFNSVGLYVPEVEVYKINGSTTLGGIGSQATTSVRQEAPCTTCQRKNDVGVKSCWCCGGDPWRHK